VWGEVNRVLTVAASFTVRRVQRVTLGSIAAPKTIFTKIDMYFELVGMAVSERTT
jgi:hypothetical protein